MILTVFRSRLSPDSREEYVSMASHMSDLVKAVPGYISHKTYTADDGERVTIVEFESEEALRAWAVNPDHVEAKKKGRTQFFSDYRVQVCNVLRDSADRARGDRDQKANDH